MHTFVAPADGKYTFQYNAEATLLRMWCRHCRRCQGCSRGILARMPPTRSDRGYALISSKPRRRQARKENRKGRPETKFFPGALWTGAIWIHQKQKTRGSFNIKIILVDRKRFPVPGLIDFNTTDVCTQMQHIQPLIRDTPPTLQCYAERQDAMYRDEHRQLH